MSLVGEVLVIGKKGSWDRGEELGGGKEGYRGGRVGRLGRKCGSIEGEVFGILVFIFSCWFVFVNLEIVIVGR